jgi:multidrug efflux pump subunit AcrA (membrane-fusion protein)
MAMKQLSRTSLSRYPLALTLTLPLLWGTGCSEVKSASQRETPTAPAAPVSVIQVKPRAVPIYKECTGSTDATGTTEIRARVDGFIEQRLFDAGQLVKANELLYVLDQGVYNAELQKTKAAMAKAETELRFAKERGGGGPARRVATGSEPSGAGQGGPGCGALSVPGQEGGGVAAGFGRGVGAAAGVPGRSERP